MSLTGDVPDGLMDSIELPASKRAKLSTENSENSHVSFNEPSLSVNFAEIDSADLNVDALWSDISDVLNHSNGDSGDVPVGVDVDAAECRVVDPTIGMTAPEEVDPAAVDFMNSQKNESQPRVRLASLFLSAPSLDARKGADDLLSVGVSLPSDLLVPSQTPKIFPSANEKDSLPHDNIGSENAATAPRVRLANIFLSAPYSSPPRTTQVSSQVLAIDPDHLVNLQTAETTDLASSRSSNNPSMKTVTSNLDGSFISSLPTLSDSFQSNHTPKSPEPAIMSETSTSQSSDLEKRRETLMGIVTGIKASPVKRVDLTIASDDKLLQQGVSNEALTALSDAETNRDVELVEAATPIAELDTSTVATDPVTLETPSAVPSSPKSVSRKSQGGVVPRKRAPRKEPKPRTPLEQRVYYSRKEIEVASSVLEDKEDLCDIIPINDCFLLADWFWIFTVQQLERALSENPENGNPSFISEMIAKFSMNHSSCSENSALSFYDSTIAAHNSVQREVVASNVTTNTSESPKLTITNVLDAVPTSLQSDSKLIGAPSLERDGVNLSIEGVSSSCNLLPQSLQTESSVEGTSALDGDSTKLTAIPQSAPVYTGPSNQDPDATRLRVIEEKIASWRIAIAEFRSIPRIRTPVQLRFHLDGPIKLLLPESTQNFFKSIELETLFSFLALRKSETGAVCDLMSIWRRECQMSSVPDLGLARHFLGIASRIEAVLSAYPPIAEADRGWMLDPISGLTGAARDFLIRHQKITSATNFLSLRTKEVAGILEVWREQNGMDVLRGSGKVAMVSAWKAYIKEAVEAESDVGRVIDLSNYLTKVQNEKYTAFLSSTKESSDTGKDASSDFSLYSKHVLERALGEGATLLLKSAGIQTAAQLFAADLDPSTSSLYKVLMDTGIVGGTPAFESAVENWRKSMKEYLDKTPGSKRYKEGHQSKGETLSHPKRNAPQVTKKADGKPHNSLSNLKEGKFESLLHVNAANEDEVFNALSFTTRQFLQTVGIRTSYDFLSSRSSDLATSFVAWRRAKGKPELKGLGSIASISGWKSIVRKKAKDLGL
jgi:hypothetical protein